MRRNETTMIVCGCLVAAACGAWGGRSAAAAEPAVNAFERSVQAWMGVVEIGRAHV